MKTRTFGAKYVPKIDKTMNISNTLMPETSSKRVFRVGLTGGIGSGKSAAANILKSFGAEIIDLDVISHQITQQNGIAIPEIQRVFGDRFIKNGALDRDLMRAEILSNPNAKTKLESITHPLIHKISKQMSEEACSKANAPYIVFVVPLLIESGMWLHQDPPQIDYLVVVDCPESLQISRVQQRSQLDIATIEKIMSYQCTRNDRLSKADAVLKNDQDLTHLQNECQKLHAEILQKTHQKQ